MLQRAPAPSSTGSGRQEFRGETALLTLAAGLLMLAMTWPAFHTFFFSEDFMYVGLLRANDNHAIRAIFTPVDGLFFRPVVAAADLLSHFLLPLDPFLYHVRNFAFSVLNLWLLHRVLRHLVRTRPARVLALLLFASSTIHFTNIGFIGVFESVVSLTLLLATVLCVLRYRARDRPLDHALALVFCLLSVFTKDYGLVVVAVVAMLVLCGPERPGESARRSGWLKVVLPMAALVPLYLAARYVAVGAVPMLGLAASSTTPVYAAAFAPDQAARKVLVFTSLLGNLSFAGVDVTGAGGVGSWLGEQQRLGLEGLCYLALLGLLGATLVVGRRAGWRLAIPLVWIAAYLGPTLLVRNLQPYYFYEPLAGAAVLLSLCLDRADRRWLRIWSVSLVLIAANGVVSNYRSVYAWQFTANAVQQVGEPLAREYRGHPLESITFLTASPETWSWALMHYGTGPLIPELLERPSLRVDIVDYAELPRRLGQADAANLLYDVDNGLGVYDPTRARAPLVLRSIAPTETVAGAAFNRQPDGASAMAVTAEGATRGTAVVVGDRRLATTVASPTYLTALVPADLLTSPGEHRVYLSNGLDSSNALVFAVRPFVVEP